MTTVPSSLSLRLDAQQLPVARRALHQPPAERLELGGPVVVGDLLREVCHRIDEAEAGELSALDQAAELYSAIN